MATSQSLAGNSLDPRHVSLTAALIRWELVNMDDPGVRSLSFAEALDSVTRLAERADQLADALRKLRESEAAALVTDLGLDADRAAAAIRTLLVCVRRSTDWYEVPGRCGSVTATPATWPP